MRTGRMRLAMAALALIFLFGAPANAEERAYRLDRPNAALQFSVKQFGRAMHGVFAEFDATLNFDRERPEDADISVSIRTASVEAGPATGAMLRAFNADDHPQIRFVSTRIEPRDDGTARVEGLLTLRGVTRPITLEARVSSADPPVFQATGFFRRSAFGIRAWPWTGDRVDLTIEAPFAPE